MFLDLILPRTDAGVLVQVVTVFPALIALLFAVRRQRELRTFVFGVTVLTAGLFALRTVH